ncbi:MAG: hypothetical protein SF066_17270 [Thermoanaerobaculia bacterium]|nr:hypothetical protein [Thermoanaerobaculia bacterium]
MIRNRLLVVFSLLAFPAWAQMPGATYEPVATQPTVGETPAGSSWPLAVSATGRYLLFSSYAPNVLVGQFDPNGSADLFLRDLVLGDTQLVSRASASHLRCAAGFTGSAFLSPDGRFVLFSTDASDVLPTGVDTNLDIVEGDDVFEYDRTTRTNRLVSSRWDDSDQPSQYGARLRAVTPDLRFLLLESFSEDLVAGITDGNNSQDVFRFDRSTGARILVSHAVGQPQSPSNGFSEAVAISADGRFLLLRSTATNLVPGYTNPSGQFQLFRYDALTQTTLLVSRSALSASTAADGQAFLGAQITPNGRWVLFSSRGSNLVPGQLDPVPGSDLFLLDADTDTMLLVDHLPGQPNAAPATSGAFAGAFTADGRYVVYASAAPDLAAGAVDTNNSTDAFLFDRTTGANRLLSHVPGNPLQAANGQTLVSFSGDLRYILFETTATDLGMVDSNNGADLILYDATTSAYRLVSHSLASASTAGNNSATLPTPVEPILDRLLFASAATDLVTGQDDQNGALDLFSFQLSTGAISALSGPPAPVVSVTPAGGTGVSASSENGQFIAFGQVQGEFLQTFLLDRQTGVRLLISQAFGQPGVPSNADCYPAFVSDDGRFVVFDSTASNLVADFVPSEFGLADYLWDRTTGLVELVAPSSAGPSQASNSQASFSGITPDGRHVLVFSNASDLVAGFVDPGGQRFHVFLRDRQTGTTALLDHAAGLPLTAANGSGSGTLSRDGRYVTLTSSATTLVAGLSDPNGASNDAFLFDRLSGQLELLSPSITVPNSTANRATAAGRLSADGRFVVLTSVASDLAPGVTDNPGSVDVFLRDRLLGTTELISHVGGAPFTAAGLSSGYLLSDDARFVLFQSRSAQLVPTTSPNSDNVFLYDRAAHVATRVSSSAYDPTAGGFWPATALAFSASGRYTLYSSPDSRFVAGFVDRNGNGDDLFLYDHGTGRSTVVSHPPYAPDLRSGEREVVYYTATMSRNGNVITFLSPASDFLLNDTNSRPDTIVVSTEIFVDGFESGDAGRWSVVVP